MPVVLFEEKKDCCGCGVCMNVCKHNAITMCADEHGFIYPDIDNEKCTLCNLCKKHCAYQRKEVGNIPLETYAAMSKDDAIMQSASGGIFTAMANKMLDMEGVVYGCAYSKNMRPEHIRVINKNELNRLKGSKYVQSNMGSIYLKVEEDLKTGRKVLFSGTPCQIDALNSYLKKPYPNLLTVDLICHGVSNYDFFHSYLTLLENKLHGKIVNFNFRDKSKGWGIMAKAIYKRGNKLKEKLIPVWDSSYYSHFLKGDIYRENCYTCKYACGKRFGDFTVGDFWGIELVHPELTAEGRLDIHKGISVLIANTDKAVDFKKSMEDLIVAYPSTFEKASRHNDQLKFSCQKPITRKAIFDIYKQDGYRSVDKRYYKSLGVKYYKYLLISLIPQPIKTAVKRIIK